MTDQESIKINGWTFEETVKTAEIIMESEKNMFKWDVLRHLRDFAENFCEEVKQYKAIGTPEECRSAVEKQKAKKHEFDGNNWFRCINGCEVHRKTFQAYNYCPICGQKLDWGDE